MHLSTGNYNDKTARIYTDIGYFTCNDDFARDIADVFNVITGYSLPSPWKRVISSPHDLRKYFFDLVDKEIAAQMGLSVRTVEGYRDALQEKLGCKGRIGVVLWAIKNGIVVV